MLIEASKAFHELCIEHYISIEDTICTGSQIHIFSKWMCINC